MTPTGLDVKGDALICSWCVALHCIEHLLRISDVPAVYAFVLSGSCVEEVAILGKHHLQSILV